jgi:tRNA-binding EMAP/Myf-like protein
MKTQHITRTILVSFLIGLVAFLAGCDSSGNGESDPALVAAEIDAGCVNEEDEIEGIITAALADNIFEIDGQPVQITPGTTEFEDGTVADLVVGAGAEAEGVLDADGVLVAVEVEIGDDGEDDDGDDAAECEEDEIEGIITAALADNIFEIDGQPVQITPGTTEFEGGTAADLVVGANAEAEGVLGADGVLVAVEVEIGDDD